MTTATKDRPIVAINLSGIATGDTLIWGAFGDDDDITLLKAVKDGKGNMLTNTGHLLIDADGNVKDIAVLMIKAVSKN